MDFMHEQLEDGRTFRLFNVIDDYNIEAIGKEGDFFLPDERVIREWAGQKFKSLPPGVCGHITTIV